MQKPFSSLTIKLWQLHARALPIELTVIGICLYTLNPMRDLWFYQSIASHEGFNSDADAYIVGFAGQLILTLSLLPLAVALIAFGILGSRRISLLPNLSSSHFLWSTFATLLATAMTIVEVDYIIYCVWHVHHWKTTVISCVYIAFIYFWWCSSLDNVCFVSSRKRTQIAPDQSR